MNPTAAPRLERRRAAVALLFARTVYAFNWYNVGAVLPVLGSALNATTPELGLVLGAFLLGVGLFQIPAGLAALRWGNRAVAISAIVVMGAFCVASAFSTTWQVLALLRFGAGAGAAFFFAPALGLFASYYPEGARGPMVGLYNSGFSLGSGVGLVVGAFAGVELGWAWALGSGGVVLLGSGLVAPLLLPRSRSGPSAAPRVRLWTEARPILRSRPLWALAISFTGLWAAFFVAAQYFVQFAHVVHPGWSLAVAAGLPTLMIVLEIPAGPIGGWLAERGRDMRWILAVGGAIASVSILVVPWVPLAGLFPVFALLGILDGAMWAVVYLLPSYLPSTRGEGLSLGLGLLNAINIFGGSGLAIAFAYVAAGHGYATAWVFAGVAAAAPLPLLLLVRPPSAKAAEPLSDPVPRATEAQAPRGSANAGGDPARPGSRDW